MRLRRGATPAEVFGRWVMRGEPERMTPADVAKLRAAAALGARYADLARAFRISPSHALERGQRAQEGIRMKRWLGVLGLVLVGLATFGCGDSITNPAQCPDVAFVVITATNADGQRVASMQVGETVRLDMTPNDNQGNPLSRICHAPTAGWDISPNGIATLLGDRTSYSPLMRADAAGTAVIVGRSGSVSASYVIRVLP